MMCATPPIPTTTTNSGTTLAIASLMGLLPQVVLSPLIGTLVDRWNRRAIMIAADALVAAATLLAGPLSDVFDVRIWYWAGGAACIVLGCLGFVLKPVMNIERTQNGDGRLL